MRAPVKSQTLPAVPRLLPPPKIFLTFALGAFFLTAAGHAIRDAALFGHIVQSDYRAPWYSPNWSTSPYTNLQLMGHPRTEYWTTGPGRKSG